MYVTAWCLVGTCALATADAGATLERRRAEEALRAAGLLPVSHPESERIAFVRIVREDVFVGGEGPLSWLAFANALHTRTREGVVRRELLLAEGDRWDEALARETERNLRRLGIFSLVRVMAAREPRTRRLGLFVYTRDLWSLRLEHAVRVTGTVVDELYVQLAERNLGGRSMRLGVYGRLDPVNWWVGGWWQHPRFVSGAGGAPHLALWVWGEVQHRRGGDPEGGRLFGVMERPFYNLGQRWSWRLAGSWEHVVVRQLRAGRVRRYDVPETRVEERLARVWRAEEARVLLRATRRWRLGWARPAWSLGWRLSFSGYAPIEQSGISTTEERRAFVRDVLPVSRRRMGPVLRYELSSSRYAETRGVDTFARREPFALGPRVWAEVYRPLALLDGFESSWLLEAGGAWSVRPFGGVLRAEVQGAARLQEGRVGDERAAISVYAVSPVLAGIGRLAARWQGVWRRRDTSRELVTLGGDDGLRGFPSRAFGVPGGNRMLLGVELRSSPLELWTVHLGLVLFAEAGSVYERLETARWHGAAGLGVRLLLPQFNRAPYRFDVGLPLGEAGGPLPSFGDGQAFDVLDEGG